MLLAKQEAGEKALLGQAVELVGPSEQAEVMDRPERIEKPHELALAANKTLAMDNDIRNISVSCSIDSFYSFSKISNKPPAEAQLEAIQETDAKDKRRVGHSKTTMNLQQVPSKEEEKTSSPERHIHKEFQPVQAAQVGVPRSNSFRTTESAAQQRMEVAASSFDFSHELSMFEPRRLEAATRDDEVHAGRDSSDVNHPAQVIAEKYWHWFESPRPAANTTAR